MKQIYTIGFSKKSLRKFVELLKSANITDLIDIRLNNTSQLAGFAKKDDLEFIMELFGIKYTHKPFLAPTEQLLDEYKKKKISWNDYEKTYKDILESRKIKDQKDEILGQGIPALLCSEEKAKQCHRRLLAEYLQEHTTEELLITHLE